MKWRTNETGAVQVGLAAPKFQGNIGNPRGLDVAGVGKALGVIGSNLKNFLGGPICCAGLMLTDAVEAAQKTPEWKRNARGVRQAFKALPREWEAYVQHLMYDQNVGRYFDPSELSDASRKRYGEMTTRTQMMEFWQLHGLACWTNSRNYITSMVHKLERRMVEVGNAEDVAHQYAVILTADLGLRIAQRAINSYCVVGAQEFGVPVKISLDVFAAYGVGRLRDKMAMCIERLDMVTPDETDEEGERNGLNVRLGMEDLERAWCDSEAVIKTLTMAMEEGTEFYRTKGEQDKALRELRERLRRAKEVKPPTHGKSA